MIVRLAAWAMGTRFELVLSGEDEFFLRSVGEQALAAIEDEHRRLSLFDPGSLLSRVNALAASRPVAVDRDLFDLLEACAAVWDASGGAFDPAVGALMRRWGHRGEVSGTEPEAAGFGSVRLDPVQCSVAFIGPGVALDLGGVAKGYALDRAGSIVREAGVGSALLHGGTSSIVAVGAPPGSEGWRVRLGGDGSGVGADLVLRDGAASVSAPSGRVSAAGAGHVMDPRTGLPAGAALEAVVVGGSGALADAWSTALVVLGGRPDRMPPELGSAVRSGAGWAVSSSLASVFRVPGRATKVECDR